MCEVHSSEPVLSALSRGILKILDLNELMPYAHYLARQPEGRRTAAGFIGYGSTRPGDRVLIAVDDHYDDMVVEALARALRERGAKVDVLQVEAEPDREFDETDEIRAIIRRRHWRQEPRRWEGIPWIEDLAMRQKYDLLIHGKGGAIPPLPFRYEAVPWLTREQFASGATVFPRDLHLLINQKAWEPIWKKGRGGRARITDPEGTSLSYTLWGEYYDGSHKRFSEVPLLGHLHSHPTPPIVAREDVCGVVAGTTSHFSRPFPRIRLEIDHGRVIKLEGGGKYGGAWNELEEESRSLQYPCFPGPGLFWMWEAAIGTNPKIVRPSNVSRLSSGGFEWERRRSGIIHLGFGTQWQGAEEEWAAERGWVYGHLHVHLLFPTLEITTVEEEVVKIIDRGRLTALDDPEVRQLAAKYGDPEQMLKEDWIPLIPGISTEGSYEFYAQDPAAYVYGFTSHPPQISSGGRP